MTVLVVVTPGGAETAETVCDILSGRGDIRRCTDTDIDARLDRAAFRDVDLVVVACNGDADAGHRVCRSVRDMATTPLALLSSSRREADELLAFARGCDDYIPTSYSPDVIRARLDGLVARAGRRRAERIVEFGSLTVDPSLRAATVDDTPVELTRTEFDLLQRLVTQQRRVIPRRELLEVGWGGCPPGDHVLDVHLSRLRRKVIKAGGPKIGVSVPGVGYRVGSPDNPIDDGSSEPAEPAEPAEPTARAARTPRILEPVRSPEPFDAVPRPAA